MRKALIVYTVLLLSAGFVAALVVGAKLSTNESSYASPPPQTPAGKTAATIAAGPALPDLSTIAERAVKASANISSTQTYRQATDPVARWMWGENVPPYVTRQAQSLGSGVVVTSDGYILTNSHVVGDASASIKVAVPGHDEMPAKIIGIDELTDLAVVKIDAQGLSTLPWADSDKVRIAEWVLAIGNPFQFNQTVTLGIVSALGRQGAQYGEMIQTDAAINPGNSGGPLINGRGELMGINTSIISRSGGSEGLGFAIPANLARRVMDQIIKSGSVNWGTIADAVFDTREVNQQVARRMGIQSDSVILVLDVAPGSPTARAGLRSGDVVLSIDGKPLADTNELQRLLADARIGSTAKLEVLRANNQRTTLDVPISSTQQQRRR
jgi:S1-C subfamily serine protease